MTAARLGLALASLLMALPVAAEPITTVLSLRGKMTMEQLAQNVRNPLSNHFNRFYEPAEIRQLAGPSDGEYRDLIRDLKAEGLTIVSESPTHLWVSVRGETAVFESLFSTRLTRQNGMRVQTMPLRIPAHLGIVRHVTGLESSSARHPHMIRLGRHTHGDLGGGIQQDTIKTAYGFQPLYDGGLNAQGQHIAIATYDGFRVENIQHYYSLSNLNPMTTVDQVKFNGDPTYKEDSSGETELDAEFSGMLAVGASVHVFASATNDDPGEVQLFTAILDDNRAKVVNYSWGDCDDHIKPEHRDEMSAVFARAVAQGVNIFVATGDSGADSCGTGKPTADWPSVNPNIVGVGGTTFDMEKGHIAESAWYLSGGGISTTYDLPKYQANLGGMFTMRSYPDVAFNANPYTGQAVYTGPEGQEGFEVVGGTSIAAPQWAGFMALVGAARAKANKADIGFFNPILYAITADNQTMMFHDVTSGDNGGYQAGTGWDAVTGFGSMQADQLLNYLVNQ